MTKSELIKILKEKHPYLQLKEASNLVDIFFGMIGETLSQDGRAELRGLGSFSVRKREARKARNPRTGESVEIGERKSVYFRAGKALKDKINS